MLQAAFERINTLWAPPIVPNVITDGVTESVEEEFVLKLISFP